MNRTICVYSSSSCAVAQIAASLGREIAFKGDSLVFGGGTVGLRPRQNTESLHKETPSE